MGGTEYVNNRLQVYTDKQQTSQLASSMPRRGHIPDQARPVEHTTSQARLAHHPHSRADPRECPMEKQGYTLLGHSHCCWPWPRVNVRPWPLERMCTYIDTHTHGHKASWPALIGHVNIENKHFNSNLRCSLANMFRLDGESSPVGRERGQAGELHNQTDSRENKTGPLTAFSVCVVTSVGEWWWWWSTLVLLLLPLFNIRLSNEQANCLGRRLRCRDHKMLSQVNLESQHSPNNTLQPFNRSTHCLGPA